MDINIGQLFKKNWLKKAKEKQSVFREKPNTLLSILYAFLMSEQFYGFKLEEEINKI